MQYFGLNSSFKDSKIKNTSFNPRNIYLKNKWTKAKKKDLKNMNTSLLKYIFCHSIFLSNMLLMSFSESTKN